MRGRLSPEVGAVVQRALEAATDRLYQESEDKTEVSASQRRADALGLVDIDVRLTVHRTRACHTRSRHRDPGVNGPHRSHRRWARPGGHAA